MSLAQTKPLPAKQALGLLGNLYESLQSLNAALCTGDGRSIFTLVEKLNSLTQESEALSYEELDEESRNLAQLMARRIREMNEINQSICHGNMRVLQNWSSSLNSLESGYKADGALRAPIAPLGVNISA
jgi:hypothetical protein